MKDVKLINAFELSKDTYDKIVSECINVVKPHVTNSHMDISNIITDMKKYTKDMTLEEKVLFAYGVGGIVSSIMEQSEMGINALDIVDSIVEQSRED